MSGEAVSQLINDEESDLNWSMSEISAVSGYDPSQHTREVSSVSTPDLALPIGRDELDQLIQNVQGLRSSLASISEKTVTPVNSPRASMHDNPDQVKEKTPPKVQNKFTPVTPPVKDPGPGAAGGPNTRLEEMRLALKSLEDAQKKSKTFKKSLDFSSSSKLSSDDKLDTKGQKLLLDKEEEVMQLKLKNQRLQEESQTLQDQIDAQSKDMTKLQHELMTKHRLLTEIKINWEQFSEEREKMLSDKSSLEKEVFKLKSKETENMNQFSLCQSELERALVLAANFKQKVDEDEHEKQCLQEQLNVAQETMKKLQLQVSQCQSRENELVLSQESLTCQVQKLHRQVEETCKDKENYELLMAREREQMRCERENMVLEYQEKQQKTEEKMKSELKANEESVHAFYLTQVIYIFCVTSISRFFLSIENLIF